MALNRGRLKISGGESHIVESWELVREDLAELLEKRDREPTKLLRLRDSHHNVARLLATGQFTNKRVAEITGYSPNRIAIFLKDPAFQELLARYREKVEEAFDKGAEEFTELLTQNMVRAERMIADRLDAADEEGELLPTRELLAISRDAADRTGHGKHQTNTNVNIDFAARLEQAIVRSGKLVVLENVVPPSPRSGVEAANGRSRAPQPVVATAQLPPPQPVPQAPPGVAKAPLKPVPVQKVSAPVPGPFLRRV